MNRRDALQGLAATVALPLFGGASFAELLEIGRRARAAMPGGQGPLRTLDAHQADTVRTLAEILLPRTETPGATDAGVTEFIDTLLTGWMEEEDRDTFLSGLAWLDGRAREAFGGTFLEGSPEQRTALAKTLDAEVAALLEADRAAGAEAPEESDEADGENGQGESREPQAPHHFLYGFKRLTLTGYFTSQPGMVQALGYAPYPGRWDPCAPLDPEPGS